MAASTIATGTFPPGTQQRTRRRRRALFWTFCSLIVCLGYDGYWPEPFSTTTSSKSLPSSSTRRFGVVNGNVMRPYNLDYLDVKTLQYYLADPPPQHEYDVAVLYYAQWDSNSHRLAPIWDQIGKLMHAGSREANVILGLFDCEQDQEHMQVCDQANVKHYPTMVYYSLSGNLQFHRKQRSTKKNPHPRPRHGIAFAGNWQYGDSVYDWVRAMKALSMWYRSGWRQKLQSFFLPWARNDKNNKNTPKLREQPLPLGIPDASPSTTTMSKSTTSSSSLNGGGPSEFSSQAVAELQKEYQDKVTNLENQLLRREELVDIMLNPTTVSAGISARVTQNASLINLTLRRTPPATEEINHTNDTDTTTKTYTDLFLFLNMTNGWYDQNETTTTTTTTTTSTASNPKMPFSTKEEEDAITHELISNEDLVLRSCVMELSVDYCTRVADQIALQWLDDLSDAALLEGKYDNIEQEFVQKLEQEEPYCVLVESCLVLSMEPDECRPSSCPFRDDVACRLLSGCFRERFQTEYAKAFNITVSASLRSPGSASTGTTATAAIPGGGAADESSSSSTATDTNNKRGWGLF